MAFQFRALHLALLGVLGAGLAGTAATSFAQTTPERLERVQVTGSNIRRTDTEGVAPVQVITREEILRTGKPNIAEVLRNLPINTGGSFNEQSANSFAPGSSGISLRGLGQKATLVLINGRRTATYAFAQNIQDTFVDLNSLPTSAIERVEILKDGASAIYGSDAIAGVVNIILRKDYQGLEATVGGGRAEGKNEYQANISGGFGDLSADKFNVFGSLDLYKRDLLKLSDTEFGETRDYRKFIGGRNAVSLTGGGTWQQYNGTTALNNFRAISNCPGTVLTGPQAVAAGLINLSTNQTAAALATATARAAATNTYCTKDFNDQYAILPKVERANFLGRANYQFTPTTLAFLEIGLTKTKTEQPFQSAFFAGTTGLQQTPAGLRPFPYNVTFAPGVAGNPYSTVARYNGVFNDLGTRDQKITSDTGRFLVGATYTFGGVDFDSAVGYSRNNTRSDYYNRTTLTGTSAALGITTAVQPPVPISTASAYNLDNPSLNSQALRDSFRTSFARKSASDLKFIDTRATTEIQQIRLPGGPLGVAVGAEFRDESLKDRADPLALAGNILGQGVTATDGNRQTQAAFVEFALPIFKQLEAQLAGRIDHYSDYGSSKTPKAGLKWTPSDVIAIRGNWGHGFRAPSLPEISPSVATFFTTVVDPEDGVSRQVSGVFVGNPTLKPETSTSATAGIVFEPTKEFSTSVDVYRIRWRNVVASPGFQQIINASCPQGGPGCPSNAFVVRDPTLNTVVTINSGYVNVNDRRTTGVDFDARYTLPTTEFGKITLRGNVSYVASLTENGVECVGHESCTYEIPRVKARFVVDYDFGPLSVTGAYNYTHSYYEDLLVASYFSDANDPRFQNGAYPQRVPAYRTYDLTARYNLTKNLTLNGSIVNIFNKLPPYDPGINATNNFDASLYDVRGRIFRASLTYRM